jgi:hypothetical protein
LEYSAVARDRRLDAVVDRRVEVRRDRSIDASRFDEIDRSTRRGSSARASALDV